MPVTIKKTKSSEPINWKRFPLTRIDKIDWLHQELLEKLTDLHRLADDGTEADVILEKLDAFDKTLFENFATEEAFMAQHGYPGLEEHRAKHIEFTSTYCIAIRRDIQDRNLYDINPLIRWFASHINQEDKEMAAFFQNLAENPEMANN